MGTFSWKSIRYPNRTGLELAGLLYSADSSKTVLIVCHGFTGSKEGGGRAVAMAEELGAMGYAVFLFDFSGCGESEGQFVDVTLTRHISDLDCTVDYCQHLGFERIITIGRSFGGTTAICLGNAGGRVSGVCTWAAPGTLSELFSYLRLQEPVGSSQLLKLSEEVTPLWIKKGFLADLDNHDVYSRASEIAPMPLLVIHGAEDEVVPKENAGLIYGSAGEPKQIAIIDQADHQFTGSHEKVWQVCFAWLREYFPLSKQNVVINAVNHTNN